MECCKQIKIPVLDPNPQAVEFYQARGFTIHYEYPTCFIVIDIKCPHLTNKGCDIYDSRPIICREYDGRLDPFVADRCKWVEWENSQP